MLSCGILSFVGHASLYNITIKTNVVHNLFLVYLYLSNSTCFGQLWAHHQEKQLCSCVSFHPAYQSYTQNNKYQVSHKHSCFCWWWAHSRPKHVEIDKYTMNILCIKFILFTRLSGGSVTTFQTTLVPPQWMNGSIRILWHVSPPLPDYTVSYPRRQQYLTPHALTAVTTWYHSVRVIQSTYPQIISIKQLKPNVWENQVSHVASNAVCIRQRYVSLVRFWISLAYF